MQRWRKAFWVWIMLLVMPLSGLASSAMPCPGGHGPLSHLTAGMADAPPCHQSAEMAAPVVPPDVAAADAGGHHCSACAACFASAALPATVALWAGIELAITEAAPPPLPGADLFVGGLERPPRAAH